MRKGFCPKCEAIVMIGDVSKTTPLHCDECNEEFLVSEWLLKADDVNKRVKAESEEQLKDVKIKIINIKKTNLFISTFYIKK